MEILSGQISAHVGKRICLHGHVQTIRSMGGLTFLVVRDRAGIFQVVVNGGEPATRLKEITLEMPIRVIGTVNQLPKRTDAFEVVAENLELLSAHLTPPSVEIGKSTKMDGISLPTLLDYRPLTLRNEKVRSIFKIESVFCHAFRTFLTKEEFIEIHTPKIVSTGTEGGAQLFRLDYFGKAAFLAQSPQFYKQIMVGVFERVFEIGPVYRAEEHDTTRHLNEYISMDLEMGFIESEQDLLSLQTRLLQFMFNSVKESCHSELSQYSREIPTFESIPQIPYAEAIELLLSKLKWKNEEAEPDLDPEAERLLCEYAMNEWQSEFLYITGYPRTVRPFYAMPVKDKTGKETLTKSFDLLFRGIEVTTGGQRIHEPNMLIESMQGRGLNPEAYSDYLQCFRFGMPPHGGLAIGLERLAKQLLGLASTKQAALFPRDRNRLTP
jgi:nondiscriminating aspartyl-tRNA synthetase